MANNISVSDELVMRSKILEMSSKAVNYQAVYQCEMVAWTEERPQDRNCMQYSQGKGSPRNKRQMVNYWKG